MSKTLLMIIEPAALMAEQARKQQEQYEYWARMNTRPSPPPIIDVQPVPDKSVPSFGVSLLIYALHTGTLLLTLGLSGWLCLVMLGQLVGRTPLW